MANGSVTSAIGEGKLLLLTSNANLNAAIYRFLVLLRTFDQRGGWHGWDARSIAHWLGWKGLDPCPPQHRFR